MSKQSFGYRPYQVPLAMQAVEIIRKYGMAYLAIEMRVGKTLIALKTMELLGAKKVLFVTAKKAITSIEANYKDAGFSFELTIINYEKLPKYQLHSCDAVIIDEAHKLGSFPKPSQRFNNLRNIVGRKPIVYCSGTPTPETYSQIYHQLGVSDLSPFNQWGSFYKWAKEFVDIREKKLGAITIRDYTRANKELIYKYIGQIMINYTQADAGFKVSEPIEKIINIQMTNQTQTLIHKLKSTKILNIHGKDVVADTPVKLMQKVHQLSSGTIKTETGERFSLDKSKAEWILTNLSNRKIAVYYKFIAEGKVLKKLIPNYTESPEEFNISTNKVFISQIQSGSMGVDLSTADYLVMYNIDFSATQYFQVRARLSNLNRDTPPIILWLFAENGIEHEILKTVRNKKDFTLSHFNRVMAS